MRRGEERRGKEEEQSALRMVRVERLADVGRRRGGERRGGEGRGADETRRATVALDEVVLFEVEL